jgi:hypothetical protein
MTDSLSGGITVVHTDGSCAKFACSAGGTEGHMHRTELGDLVRSKSELVIANKLHARRIAYVYEQPLSITLPLGAS